MGYGMKYTKEMQQFILDNYKGISTNELAELLNSKFGTCVTASMMKSYKGNRKLDSGLDGRFLKGHQPHNKGMKMTEEVYEKVKHTMFRKGNVPINHRAVGSERINVDGYIEIKIAEPNKWRLKHNVIWQEHNGKIPKENVVVFLDRDKLNCDITNLKLIKRSELLIMNRYALYQEDAASNDTVTNLARLIDSTNKVKKR